MPSAGGAGPSGRRTDVPPVGRPTAQDRGEAARDAAAEVARETRAAATLRASLEADFEAAWASGDAEALTAAALRLPTGLQFGAHPGRTPALLYRVYAQVTDPATRCRLAAALARCWVYGGDAAKAVGYADEAQRLAAEAGGSDEPDLLTDVLDATLLTRWGPDGFEARAALAARLDDVVSRVADPDLRLRSHLWRLTTAWEGLDVVTVQRQLRALDQLADETGDPRTAFFATSRRAMAALAAGDLAAAEDLIARTREAGAGLDEPDVPAVLHSLAAARAQLAGDLVALRSNALAFDAFGTAEGVQSVLAEAAALWLAAGEPEAAAEQVERAVGAGVESIPRDVDFLLTTAMVVGVAAAVGLIDLAATGASALEPYAGRGVLNSGAVVFHGVVDDYLYRARTAVGDPSGETWRRSARQAYRRVGARWWERQLGPGPAPAAAAAATVCLYRLPDGTWVVGPARSTLPLPDLKGLHYLRYLVERPGMDVTAAALTAAVAGHPGAAPPSSDAGEVVDTQALAAYRRRLADLDDELERARSWADPVRAERLRLEREALLDQVRAAVGLGGRRRVTGSTDERARVAVRKAVAAALERVERRDPATARLLRDTVRTGGACRYDPQPDRPVTWVTAAPAEPGRAGRA